MHSRILRTPDDLNTSDIRTLYAGFDTPVTDLDCGQMCAPHNPTGKPFCCDICHAVPAAYQSEWDTLRDTTELWHPYRGDECDSSQESGPVSLLTEADMPPGMIPLACLGPKRCERENRLLSCRQFPFFPYVNSDYRFLGLAYDWEYESTCWVVSNLGCVTDAYCVAFVRTYDHLFALFQDEFESYALRSEELRAHFASRRRRFVLLHREGSFRLVSPINERTYHIESGNLPRFGAYQ